jgi:hypothetical protein
MLFPLYAELTIRTIVPMRIPVNVNADSGAT